MLLPRTLAAAALSAALLLPARPAAGEATVWKYDFKPRLHLEYDIYATYHANGVSTQRFTPEGDGGGGASIGGAGGSAAMNASQPPIGTHDGGGSSSFRVLIDVDEIEASGKAACSVQFVKMTGAFDAPGMAGRTLPICLFPQLQGRVFRAVISPDGGIPELPEYPAFLKDAMGADLTQAKEDLIVRETGRALAACLPALPAEADSKPGSSYKVGELAYVVGAARIFKGRKAVVVAGKGPDFDKESDHDKVTIREKGGFSAEFYFGTECRLGLGFAEKHWRDWSQKAHTVMGNRTDSHESITYASTLVKFEVPKEEPGTRGTGEDGKTQK